MSRPAQDTQIPQNKRQLVGQKDGCTKGSHYHERNTSKDKLDGVEDGSQSGVWQVEKVIVRDNAKVGKKLAFGKRKYST